MPGETCAVTGTVGTCTGGSSSSSGSGSNTSCTSATTISSLTYTTTGSTTAQSGERWYKYLPDGDDCSIGVSTCSMTTFDTVVEIYGGCMGGSPSNFITSNDDACGSASSVVAALPANTYYYVRVKGYDDESYGTYGLSVSEIYGDCF